MLQAKWKVESEGSRRRQKAKGVKRGFAPRPSEKGEIVSQ
jgi:hypothetical protein